LIVALVIAAADGSLVAKPQTFHRGVPFLEANPELLGEVRATIQATFDASGDKSAVGAARLAGIRKDLGKLLYRHLGRRPLVELVVTEL
jgi:mRNA degradation ribonuclease J1/J2